MKKLFKTFAVLAISSTIALANVGPQSFKVGMYNVQNTHKLKVFIDKENTGALVLEVLDNTGTVIQKELVGKNQSKAAISLDMSSLESGDYKLKISDKFSSYTKDIHLEKQQKEELKIVI